MPARYPAGVRPGRDGLRAVAVSNRRKVALATAVIETQNAAALSPAAILPPCAASVLLRVYPPDKGAASPAAILRRRHRCEGAAPFSARYPAGVGAATEFAGCFNRMIIPAMGIDRVIVRRTGVRVRLLVAMGVRVAVMRVREGRSAVLRQDLRFRQCQRCGFRFMENKRSGIGAIRWFSPFPVGFDTRGGDFVGFGSRRPPFDTQCTFSTLLPRDFRLSGGAFDPPETGFDPPSDWVFVSLGWLRHPRSRLRHARG